MATNQNKPIDKKNKKTTDPRKHPRPGYDEKNPTKKEDVQEHPENQNSG